MLCKEIKLNRQHHQTSIIVKDENNTEIKVTFKKPFDISDLASGLRILAAKLEQN